MPPRPEAIKRSSTTSTRSPASRLLAPLLLGGALLAACSDPVPEHTVTVDAIGVENGAVAIDGVAYTEPVTVQEGSDVTITATPEAGYEVAWGGACEDASDTECTLTGVATDQSVEVAFEWPVDPPADPDIAPPPAITDPTIATSGSVALKDAANELLEISVAGFAGPDAGAATGLGDDDFVLVEDGKVQGIVVRELGTSSSAAQADIAFVLDTTGSMAGAITSVQDSIIAFADYLDGRGLDVRVGAVTYGDAYDTVADGSTTTGTSFEDLAPPGFDDDERPSFALTSDYEAFKTFIGEQEARSGGDGLENGLGALEQAYEAMDWRPGAQRLMIVVTDICSHTPESQDFIAEPFAPPAPADLLADLRGRATVHVVSPDHGCYGSGADMADLTGVAGTGGVHVPWSGAEFDLSALPIAEVAASGYVITWRGAVTGGEHSVRLVIDDGGEVRGELQLVETY